MNVMTNDFLFHKVSEDEREEIKQEAKEIMEKFSEKLSKIDERISDSGIERNDSQREENDSGNCDEDFRKRMFENAPNKNKDFILAEKKGW